MEEIKEPRKETDQLEPPYITALDSYILKQQPEIPSLEHVRYINEEGKPVETKPITVEDVTYFHRNNQPFYVKLILICSLVYLLIILSATGSFTEGIWNVITGIGNGIVKFFFGFFPEIKLPF